MHTHKENVAEWLNKLELEEYTELFYAEGYETEDDIENLKDLTEDHFRGMGIVKRGNLYIYKTSIQ